MDQHAEPKRRRDQIVKNRRQKHGMSVIVVVFQWFLVVVVCGIGGMFRYFSTFSFVVLKWCCSGVGVVFVGIVFFRLVFSSILWYGAVCFCEFSTTF